jgi:pyruvate dehydrogenase E1 component
VDAKSIAYAALAALAKDGAIQPAAVKKALKDLGVNPDKPNPAIS